MNRGFSRGAMLALVLVVGLTFVAAAALWFRATVRRGFSARESPSRAEAYLAGRLRAWSVSKGDRRRRNPLASSPAAVAAGRAHFADHCASCHGNDGRGDTEIGRNLYPRAPDMQSARTQGLSDGEVFAIIKNGVRMTGMPAWGGNTPADDEATWQLVAFVRHLPKITPDELAEMRSLNPISPAELAEKKEEEEFLAGGKSSPAH